MKICFLYHFYPHYRSGFIKSAINRYPDSVWVSSGMDGLEGIDGVDPAKFGGIAVKVDHFSISGLLYQRGLIGLIQKGNFDAVVFLANPNFISTWIAAIVARVLGVKVIFWAHGILDPNRTKKNLIRSIFFSLADACYFYGYRAKENAMRYPWIKKDRIFVGFNSLDYDGQLVVRKRMLAGGAETIVESRYLTETIRLVCISRLTKKCEYELLIRAVSKVEIELNIRFEITFIGDGPERLMLESLSSSLDVASKFIGTVYDESRIGEIVFHADAVVSPGKVGLTAVHALMYGTPVITHSSWPDQMPEVEAIVEGVTGHFFEKGSVKSLAEALRKLTKIDRKRRAVVREACFVMVDRIYNPENQTAILKNAIDGKVATQGDEAFRILEGLK